MDASGSSLDYIVLVLLLILSAFFSGSETALLAANKLRLRQLDESGNRRAGLVRRLLAEPGRVVTALLVGNNIVNVALTVFATALLVHLWGPQRGTLYALVGLTLVLLVAGEITPKSIAAKYADRLALWVSRPVAWLTVILGPVIRVLSLLSNLLMRPLGGRVDLDSPLVTEEEIRLLVKVGEEEGVIQEEEREMITSIFEFGDTVAREVMVPRIDMVCVADTDTVLDALRVIRETAHSRLPVYHGTIDQIVGVVHVKDLLPYVQDGRGQTPVKEASRPAYFVPESTRLDNLFREMRRRKVHLAIVVDEYGGTAGLVTIEDLLEEIVGPILDEYDVEEKLVEPVTDGVALVDGRVSLEEVNEHLNLDLPVGEVDTIGGFVYSLLGHVPAQGESVTYDGVELVVERLEGHRIARVRVIRRTPTEPLRS
ncbi:MAG: hemolysin family protein [Armatimonadota bacterium]|nr:hemolysin family protein [Armatimonadota bacterium]MDR7451260.1 hemolysin family protein [Armatimonadota bacterium]MDR7466837.1 hemolysin family protein [Armatimonadota bacterium]MDR7492690.1 hemolysin family protein [Armatimonadota bacterium]MDR7499619.1 hemolysin family protein [Armatimonadota bacterium]